MTIKSLCSIALTVCAVLVPIRAAAQQATPPSRSLQVEQLESGFVVAPDVRFAEINDDFATFAGAYVSARACRRS